MPDAPKTIAFAIEASLPLRGGVNVLVETLIESLPDDWRVVLLSVDPQGSDPRTLHPRVSAHVPWNTTPTSPAQARDVAAKLHALGVRLVHFHGGVFGFGMRFFGHCPIRPLRALGVRTVWTDHTWRPLIDGFCDPAKPWLIKAGFLPLAWTSRLLELRALDVLTASSKYALRKERALFWPVRSKMRLLYYTRSSEALPAADPREKTIVSVGHVARRKGQLTLLRAFRQIAGRFPEWRLQIVGPPGEADYASWIENEARHPDLQGRVEIVGGVRDGWRYTLRAGIFVQPSVFEGLPVALMEAFSLSTPCVATACQGNDELIENEKNCLATPIGDESAMAAALARMIEDEPLRARLGAAAREFVIANGMTIEAMKRNHLEMYEQLIGDQRR